MGQDKRLHQRKFRCLRPITFLEYHTSLLLLHHIFLSFSLIRHSISTVFVFLSISIDGLVCCFVPQNAEQQQQCICEQKQSKNGQINLFDHEKVVIRASLYVRTISAGHKNPFIYLYFPSLLANCCCYFEADEANQYIWMLLILWLTKLFIFMKAHVSVKWYFYAVWLCKFENAMVLNWNWRENGMGFAQLGSFIVSSSMWIPLLFSRWLN